MCSASVPAANLCIFVVEPFSPCVPSPRFDLFPRLPPIIFPRADQIPKKNLVASVVNQEVQVEEASTVYTNETVYDKSTVMTQKTIEVRD